MKYGTRYDKHELLYNLILNVTKVLTIGLKEVQDFNETGGKKYGQNV